MHAAGRRVPVERARHAKRLGHVQAPSGQAFPVLAATPVSVGAGTTTATQSAVSATIASSNTVPTSTPTGQSPSSALPSSSLAQSSSFALSSVTTQLTSSSPSTFSPAVTTPSSSLTTPATMSTSTSPTASSTTTPQTNVTAVTNSGLSGGAIAGIIAGAAIVGAALIVFFVRKTYLRRREHKHISWNGAPGLDEPKLPDVGERSDASSINVANTPPKSAPLSPFEAYGHSMYTTPVPPVVHMHSTIPTYAVLTPPSATYNNPTSVATFPTQPGSLTYNSRSTTASVPAGTVISSASRTQHAPLQAIVKCTFVPTLPDELSITTGERIFVVEQYDDGWDLCANGRGERGMVPRECLGHTPSNPPDIGWRNMKRMSSLNADGRRY